ncbi:MAG TPA: histone deacetylase, partial [Abditibacteriaceae bacterium]|nr:histone deacetylase [Abditibacteriaceae bacterium]
WHFYPNAIVIFGVPAPNLALVFDLLDSFLDLYPINMKTAFFSHRDFRSHDNGPYHPEQAARLDAIDEALRQANRWDALERSVFEPATDEQLLLCHTPTHIEKIRQLAQSGGGRIDAAPTYVGAASYEVARLAAGAACAAVDAVLQRACDNAFVAARPPGHHAESNRAMGFCLFNNVAIAARHAQRGHDLQRVAILDWDVHHGNGTQEIFYADPSVFFVSAHQWPLYPGTGRREERGLGAGIGTTLNFPLPAGCGDEEYYHVWDMIAAPLEEFAPQMILLSAGFDAHMRDPLAGMQVSTQGFRRLMRMTKQWAGRFCDNRLVCLLEGGYDLTALGDSTASVIEELLSDEYST